MSYTKLKLPNVICRAAGSVSLAALIGFAISGCAINRVTAVKQQFCEFDRNFSYSLSGRPEVVFTNPVLLSSDVDRVIGYKPTQTFSGESGFVHSYVFEKLNETEGQGARFPLDFHYQFEGDRSLLKSVQFPAELTSMEQFETLDHAEQIAVSADKICNYSLGFGWPSMEDDIDPAVLETLPSRALLTDLLGMPSSESDEGALIYEYQVRGQVALEPALRMAVWFDESGTRPLRMETRYGSMGSNADFVAGKVYYFYSG